MKNYKYIILGGGTAAGYAADEFVKQGVATDELCIVSKETTLPPDRPPFSKDYLREEMEPSEFLINDEDFYSQKGIDVLLKTQVTGIDLANKLLELDSGEQLGYEYLLIATGATPRNLGIPGASNENVFYLRDRQDADKIIEKAKKIEKALVIGGQFIGTEVAASLSQLGLDVTFVYPDQAPMSNFNVKELGEYFINLFKKNNVTLIPGTKVKSLEGNPEVTKAILENGQTIETEMVVAGIGVTPNTALFEGSEMKIDDGIIVNEYCETSVENVYAAGDVARFPDAFYGHTRRIEHWDNAFQMGQHAAKVITGYLEPYNYLPFFFSDVFDLSYEFYGDVSRAQNYIIRGNIDEGDFSILWTEGDLIIAGFFTASRPEEEKEKTIEYIKNKTFINQKVLADTDAPFGEDVI
ncbi:MAG TPA: FAD/NAD(P)-binding oxidoreductase [Bacteroidales bacterium]|nr:FAD/NAD(P)-binding oxidoreductase [Bacteroidales bacterium]